VTLPNKLTLARIALTPLFVAALVIGGRWWLSAALLVGLAAAVTDLVDGRLARKHDAGSTFGEFADPLADKLFVLSALVAFAVVEYTPGLPVVPFWLTLIVLWRELVVTGLRAYAAHRRRSVPASRLGKAKTLLQMTAVLAIVALLALRAHLVTIDALWSSAFDQACRIGYLALLGLAVLQSLVSGVDYLLRARDLLRTGAAGDEDR